MLPLGDPCLRIKPTERGGTPGEGETGSRGNQLRLKITPKLDFVRVNALLFFFFDISQFGFEFCYLQLREV